MKKIQENLRACLKKHTAAHPEFLETSALKNEGIAEFKAVITALQ
jgi:hypothetical protein